MAHPQWPGFDSKTGDPVFDNVSRNLNRRMWRYVRASMKITTPGGRRRKKHLVRVEGEKVVEALAALMNAMAYDPEINHPRRTS